MKSQTLVLGLILTSISWSAAAEDAVIMNRLYPKASRLELGLDAGTLLNPTFVDATLAQASLRYFFDETWGLGVSLATSTNRDRRERRCVETFYADPDREVDAACAEDDGGTGLEGSETASVRPAYMPIRELHELMSIYADYTIAHGKQILLHGATSHFDLRLRMGAGVTVADFYEQKGYEEANTGMASGREGRPQPEREETPHLYLGLGEELLLYRRLYVEGELATYLLIGARTGLESFFVARLGLGFRL